MCGDDILVAPVMPLYVRSGARIKVYPEAVSCTDEMDMEKTVELAFDNSFAGIGNTVVGEVTGLA